MMAKAWEYDFAEEDAWDSADERLRQESWVRAWQAVRNGHIVYRIVDGVTYEVGATEHRPYLVKGDVIYPWVW